MPFNASGASVVFNGDYNDYGSNYFGRVDERSEGLVRDKTPHIYIPPYSVSPRFTGQQVYLDQLQGHFNPSSATGQKKATNRFQQAKTSITKYIGKRKKDSSEVGIMGKDRRCALLHGIGGVGKTQLALKFAEKNSETFWRIFWIDASNVDTIELGLKSIAEDPDAKAVGVDSSVNSVLRWLSGADRNWLLIYDNADGDPDNVAQYIPTGTGGNILLTSRNPNLARLIAHEEAVIEVVDMSEDEAISLLLKWVAPEASSTDAQASARSIVKELSCLPLAVDQAGAAIKSGLCAINSYLILYKSRRNDLMTHRSFRGASNYGRAVYTTWELSYKMIQDGALGTCSFITPDAADSALLIIEIYAFFHRDHIPEEIIRRAAESHKPLSWGGSEAIVAGNPSEHAISTGAEEFLQRLTRRFLLVDAAGNWDPFPFREGIQVLKSFSLIKSDSRTQAYSMHPMVHSWSRDRLSDDYRKSVCRSASALLAHSITQSHLTTAYTFRRDLVPHIRSCSAHQAEAFGSRIYAEKEFISFALAYQENGLLKEAEELQVRVLESRQNALGTNHPDTLTITHSLAWTYWGQGLYKEAVELQTRAVELRQTVLGAEHPHTLLSMVNLAVMYLGQGRYREAEKLQVRVLHSTQTTLGAEHPYTLASMNNLASTYQSQGRHKEAEELLVRVLELYQIVFGPEYPGKLTSMHVLATIYLDQGRYKEAEELLVQVLELRQTVLGAEHPDTLQSMNNLATTYFNQERYKEAAELLERVLELKQIVLGAEHPETLLSMSNLATTYWSQGRGKEAEELEVQILELRQTVLGAEHPHTLMSMHNLAVTYMDQGRHKDAEELLLRVLELRQEVLGAEHPHTLLGMHNLAVTWSRLDGRDQDAKEMMQKVVDLRTKVLGLGHPDTVRSIRELGEWTSAADLVV